MASIVQQVHLDFYHYPGTLILLFSYLIGSVPFGFLFSKIFGYGDIRAIGSGNIGATNVLRTGNKKVALLTLISDAGKAAFAIAILTYFFAVHPKGNSTIPSISVYSYTLLLGTLAVLGHCFPVWLKFRGGKGVATSLGALLAAVPYAGLAACAAWLITAFAFKISSLAALVALAVAPVVTFFIYGPAPAMMCAAITLLVWVRHTANIKRLLKGEEPKIGNKKKE